MGCRLNLPGTWKASIFLPVFRQRVLGRVTSVTACSCRWLSYGHVVSLILLLALNTIRLTDGLTSLCVSCYWKRTLVWFVSSVVFFVGFVKYFIVCEFVFIVSRSTACSGFVLICGEYS